ncbi:MAG: DUF4440 domain-containing protein [Ignavibacteriales bacterium]|nr:DUF4440 domain-containing protein [Ignavibacteriales bacterium]
MKQFSKLFFFVCVLQFFPFNIYAQNDESEKIKKILTSWVDSFNKKDLQQSLAIYSEDFIGYYPNQPDQNYASIKEEYEHIFNNKNLFVKLDLVLIEVKAVGNLAYAGMNLTATVKPTFSKQAAVAVDKGLQIWQKQNDGNWKMIRSSSFAFQPK